MPYAKTWKHVLKSKGAEFGSTLYTQTRRLLFELKQGLVSSTVGPWTVVASSNGAVANTNDNWTSSDSVSWVTAVGSPHSWIVLKSPNVSPGPYYFIIDYVNPTNNYGTTIHFTKTQPNISSPSINNRPPALGTESTQSATLYNSNAGVFCTRINLICAHDGSWIMFATAGAYDGPMTIMIFNVFNQSTVRSSDTFKAGYVWLANRTAIIPETDGSVDFKRPDAALPSSYRELQSCYMAYAGNTSVLDFLREDKADGKWPLLPIYLFNADAGVRGFMGTPEDIYWAPKHLTDGSSISYRGTVEYMKMGPFAIPTPDKHLPVM